MYDCMVSEELLNQKNLMKELDELSQKQFFGSDDTSII